MALNHYTTPAGQSGLEAKLRAIQDDLRKLKVCESSTIKVEQTTRGQVLTAVVSRGGIAGAKMFRFQSGQDDYITCREFDGTTEGSSDVLIAKPYDIRVTGWDNQIIGYNLEPIIGGGVVFVTYSKLTSTYRTASRPDKPLEYQAIRPFYVAGKSIIFAIKPSNGTGVTGCDWIDLNTDGRAFAKIA